MSKTVLVVDDAMTVRNLAKFALSKGGYTIIEAADGAEGLKIAQSQTVDLIISDLNMPNMDGLQMSQQIKENPSLKHIPIFMLTTEASTETAERGKKIGILAWIVKPFVPDKLLGAVQKVLGG